MKGDFTRFTFRKDKHYSAVRMQQGRVQMDADWNEHVDIQAHSNRTGMTDVIGKSGIPYEGGGFQIGVSGSGDTLTISKGRIYVDGILCENGVQEEPDPGSPSTSPPSQPVTTYNCQPYYPNPEYPSSFGSPPSVASPPKMGDYLTYMDVWERHITALDDKEIRDVALGGPDTATRSQIIWQVKLEEAYGSPQLQCSDYANWHPDAGKVKGAIAAQVDEAETDTNPCSVPAAGGYRRLENQLYRVEIHESSGTPTFKWSRENGSVVARLLSSKDNKLKVSHPRSDELTRFATGDWVEAFDDSTILHKKPGLFIKIGEVNGDLLEIAETYGTAQLPESGFIRKWEGGKPIAIDYAEQALESGIKVKFKSGLFSTGDYWTIPARTISHSIQWPKDKSSGEPLYKEREGIIHHYCALALVHFDGLRWNVLSDCRNIFPPLTSMLRFFYLGGDGQEATPDLSNPTAPVALDQPLRVGVSNGALPLSGQTVHFSIEKGSGQLGRSNNTSPGDFTTVNQGEVLVKTNPAGVAECKWLIYPTEPTQVVEGRLLDSVHGIEHQTIQFHANPSIASEVAYKIPDCTGDTPPTVKSLFQSNLGGNWPDMDGDGKATVKDILDTLFCKLNATHLPVDKNDLCDYLKNDVNVKTVQDAVNALCEMDWGRSCSIVISPDERLEEVLKKLLEIKSTGVSICLLPGTYVFKRFNEILKQLLKNNKTDICIQLLPGTFTFNELPESFDGYGNMKIGISGCGPNTRIIVTDGLSFKNLASMELTDITIGSQEKLESLLLFDGCENVSVKSCRLSCLIQKGFLLGISRSNSIHLENNIIEAYDPKGKEIPIKVFKNIDVLEKVFRETNRNMFIRVVNQASKELSGLSLNKRKEIAKKLTDSTKSDSSLSESEKAAYNLFASTLKKDKAVPEELISALLDIKDVNATKYSATAVAILDANERTVFDNNRIRGDVSIYGMPGEVKLDDEELKKLSEFIKKSVVIFSGLSGILQFRNNDLNRIMLGEDFINIIKKLIKDQKGEIRRTFKIGNFSENTFNGGENQFSVQYLNMTSNGFYLTDNGGAGWSLAQTSIYVGNSPDEKITLLSVAGKCKEVSNLITIAGCT